MTGSEAAASAMRAAREHYQAERLAQAEQALLEALKADPERPEALNLLGVIANRSGDSARAADLIGRALRGEPANANFLSNLGMACHAGGRLDDALAAYDQALALQPGHPQATRNRARVLGDQAVKLQEAGRYDEALALFGKVLALQPANAAALGSRGALYCMLGRHEQALGSLDASLALDARQAGVHANRGAALHALGRYDEALAACDAALKLAPADAVALGNRATVLQWLGRYDEAIAGYERALAADPALAQAEFGESLCRLTLGDFARGWRKHEARWRTREFRKVRRDFPQPLWLGEEDVRGKTVLLHAEQGQGDTLQFARYVPMVAAKGARIVLEVQPPLQGLLSRLEGVERVLGRGETLPPFDLHCPLMSLPLALGGERIPAAIPYLRSPAEATLKWKTLLGEKNAPRIGIAWSGDPKHVNDRNRSIALARLLPLQGAGVQLVSLQKDVRLEDERTLRANGGILHFGPKLADYADTAALVSLLDLVVSVDTSIAHLAGALGKRVWILLPFVPDWRWRLEREDTPWYPQARLFRQPKPGDWDGALAALSGALQAEFGCKTSP